MLHPTIIYEYGKARHEELLQEAQAVRLVNQGWKRREWTLPKLGNLFAKLIHMFWSKKRSNATTWRFIHIEENARGAE